MMDEILLNSKRSKRSVDVENTLSVGIESTERILPPNSVVDKVNSFSIYENECNISTKYRLIFGINSVCTNVLFNAITEVVKDEGADKVIRLNNNSSITPPTSAVNKRELTQHQAIKNTEYNNEACGMVYHCGYDIFNNHLLRSETFKSVNKIGTQRLSNGGVRPSEENRVFNTIEDYTRLDNGKLVEEYPIHNVIVSPSNKRPIHLYQYDDIMDFYDSVVNNLGEENGWFGFTNVTKIPTLSSADETKSINKVMNKNKSCEIIDMYPDRSLYSFDPIFNKFKKRLEYNWLSFLTYPFSSTTNDLVEFSHSDKKLTGIKSEIFVEYVNTSGIGVVIFTCKHKHGFKRHDKIRLYYGVEWETMNKLNTLLTIENVGNLNGEDKEYSFYVKASDLNAFKLLERDISGDYTYSKFVFRRYVSGFESDYYYRIFRKLPNFKFSEEIPTYENVIDEEFLNKNTIPFNNTLNRTAYGENIYGDEHVELIFTDDINIDILTDNLGRPIHEIYLTILKNNKGYEKWYGFKSLNELTKKFPNGAKDRMCVITNDVGNGVYYEWNGSSWIVSANQNNTEITDTNGDIEFSHAFGKVNSGLDLPMDVTDKYNVKYLHNAGKTDGYFDFKESAIPLEDEITIDGGIDSHCFMGDLVEYIPSEVKEIVLEDVFHRFNTAQRETNNILFRDLLYDDLISDDYEIPSENPSESFKVEEKRWNEIETTSGNIIFSANKYPEGYYYKPHYRIQVRGFDDTIKHDIKSAILLDDKISVTADLKWSFKTKMNYYLDINDYVYVVQMENGKDVLEERCKILRIDRDRNIVIEKPNNILLGSDFVIRKENYSIPFYAKSLSDGSGRYLWRDFILSSQFVSDEKLVFTNGAIYIEKSLNFFLRRQDPFGEYGVNINDVSKFSELGEKKDVSNFEYQNENESDVC